jgi:hypothetical protein
MQIMAKKGLLFRPDLNFGEQIQSLEPTCHISFLQP